MSITVLLHKIDGENSVPRRFPDFIPVGTFVRYARCCYGVEGGVLFDHKGIVLEHCEGDKRLSDLRPPISFKYSTLIPIVTEREPRENFGIFSSCAFSLCYRKLLVSLLSWVSVLVCS
jgi:hypothetical protein